MVFKTIDMKKEFQIGGIHIRFLSEQEISSDVESELFCSLTDDPDIEIKLEAVDEIPAPSGVLALRHREHPVYRSGNQIARIGWDLFQKKPHVRTDYSLTDPHNVHSYIRREDWKWATSGKYLWPGVSIQSLLLHHRVLMMHASCIEHNGKGILFTAPSGTGKSTQAHLWQRYRDANIINGDKAAIRVMQEVMCHGVPFSGTSGLSKNISVPLKAIVVLAQGPENIVRKLSVSEAVAMLYPNIYVDSALAEENQLALSWILELMELIPILHLTCTPDERAVETLENAMRAVF